MLYDLTLEQINWEIAEADLNDAIKHLQECRERLEQAMSNLKELTDKLIDKNNAQGYHK